MQFEKVAKDMFGATEARDPETVVIMVMDELIKAVKTFHKNISIKTGDLISRSKSFSRAISVIYMLQSSLDLERGEQIAYDLFRLYEFLRIHLIKDLRTGSVNKSSTALNSIVDIKIAWLNVAAD